MEHKLLILSVDNRIAAASKIQEIFTKEGCIIKTRIGLHEGVLNQCSNKGIIILELVGEKKNHDALVTRLDQLEGVKSQIVEI